MLSKCELKKAEAQVQVVEAMCLANSVVKILSEQD